MAENLLKICLALIYDINIDTSTQTPEISSNSRQHAIVKSALEYMTENISSSILISKICQELHISESYLYQSFKKVTGISPQQYILQYKIRCAERMIGYEGYSIKETAFTLGFSSGYHLSSSFKKILGKAPKYYFETNLTL